MSSFLKHSLRPAFPCELPQDRPAPDNVNLSPRCAYLSAMMARIFGLAILAAVSSWAQGPPPPVPDFEQPNAQRTQQELSNLLQRYPPALREVLALDPSLLANESYLAPYPALVSFLRTHPEIARASSYYVGEPERPHEDRTAVDTARVWENMLTDVMVFAG